MSLSNIANPKSILAKLLAQENLTVEHRKIHTASFDPVNRVLCLPIWKDMSSDLYDLLVGHEVGHAWETPAEGWHNAIEEKGRGFKSFLNVVEDARIEKCIKSRYPGLRAPFYRAYKDLFESDFFGIKKLNIEIDELPLIDRLNLHFKVGPFLNVPFLDAEKHFVNRMDNLESWDDVYALAAELYVYHKEENPYINFDDIEGWKTSEYNVDGDEDGEFCEYDGIMPDPSRTSSGSGDDVESITDKMFREREKDLLADNVRPYVYCNLPKVKTENFVVPYRNLYNAVDFDKMDNFKKYYLSQGYSISDPDKLDNVFDTSRLYKEYRERNTKYIQYLVKEFELKRNAAQYARASVAKSGELDLNKVWSYKIKEDLFKRVTKIPKGKNHGMVMFIDWSGSMTNNLTNTIEQFLILSDFCKKVSIPFEVYCFTDTRAAFLTFFKNQFNTRAERFSLKEKDLVVDLGAFSLLNLLSSKMSSNEYRNAQGRLLQIAECYKHSENVQYGTEDHMIDRIKSQVLPTALSLSGTPLDESIVLAISMVNDFKQSYKLDIVNTIFLTDGDGNDHSSFIREGTFCSFRYATGSPVYNIVLKDPLTGIMTTAKPNEPVTVALLKMLKAITETNLVGYFVYSSGARTVVNNMANKYGQFLNLDEAANFIRKFKYYGMKNTGYDDYFLVRNKDMEISDQGIDTGNDTSKRALVKAFMQNQKSKILNRVLLSKFIERIA